MKKIKIVNAISLFLNLAIFGLVLYTTLAVVNSAFVNYLSYYTFLSNLFVGVAALIVALFNIRGIVSAKKLPKAIFAIKLVATVSVAATLLFVLAFLVPTQNGNFAELLFGNFNINSTNFMFHLLVPVLAILTFLFADQGEKLSFPVNFFSVLPVLLYFSFYVINYFVQMVHPEGVGYDWYGLFNNDVTIAILILIGAIFVALLLSILFWLINRKLGLAYFKEEKESAPVEEPQEELLEEEKEEEKTIEEEENLAEEDDVSDVLKEPIEETIELNATEARPRKKEEEIPEPVEEEEKEEEEAPAKKAEPAKKAASAKKAAPSKKESAAKKPAPVKKPIEEKPAPVKKPAPAAKEESEAQTKVYHLTKRKEDGMWAITFVGGQKAVKLFKTKKEAQEYLEVLTKNQGATALIRNSKGAKAGKFASSIKSTEEK